MVVFSLVIILIFYKSGTGQASPSDLILRGDLMDDVSILHSMSLRHGSYELIRGSNQYIMVYPRFLLPSNRSMVFNVTSDPVGLGPPYILPPFHNPYSGTTASTSLVLFFVYANALPSKE
jgi:hypothetical protein